jgi:hypothetical protein
VIHIRNNPCHRKLHNVLHINSKFEVVFISVRPRVLPRPLTILNVAVVYCPPWYDAATNKDMCDYIHSAADSLARHYPCAGFVIVGDFNTVETNIFNKYLSFKRIVTSPTRGKNILDKIFTNCNTYYSVPTVVPPIGKSDHNIIFLSGHDHVKSQVGYQVVTRRQRDFNTVNRNSEDLANVADRSYTT